MSFSQMIANPAVATTGGLAVLTLMTTTTRAGEWLNSIGTRISTPPATGDQPAQPALLAFEPKPVKQLPGGKIAAADLIARESGRTRMYPGKAIPFKATS
jgi:hypothetical protein